MRKYILAAGIAAAALTSSLATAAQPCEGQHSDRVVGTVAGAGIGAVLGSVIAGHGDKTTGAVIGGVGGGLIGNQVTKSKDNCDRAYGYYDRDNRWHASAVARGSAVGYYDRDGLWVEGAPNGYYGEGGRWISAKGDASASGYYDSRNHWIPASAEGYYDADDRWVAGTASGYYDSRGRWVAGPTIGQYDANGRWMAGTARGHQDANGRWIADAQPGYYDSNGRWHAGPATGYYDGRGNWISTASRAENYRGDGRDADRRDRADMPRDISSRFTWLDHRIRSASENGTLSRRDARLAYRDLNSIRRKEGAMRHHRGQLSQRDEAYIQSRLDRLSDSLRAAREARRGG